MYKIVIGFAVSLLFLTYAEGSKATLYQKGQPTSVRLKDTSRYEKLGPCEVPADGKNFDAVSAEVRGFIWEHWTRHRQGHVIVVSRSKEGERSTSHMFIEPDERGDWHLSARVEKKAVDRRAFDDPEFQGTIERYERYKAYVIERIEVPADGLSGGTVIPLEQKRGADSYRLRLKNRDGKVIAEL